MLLVVTSNLKQIISCLPMGNWGWGWGSVNEGGDNVSPVVKLMFDNEWETTELWTTLYSNIVIKFKIY